MTIWLSILILFLSFYVMSEIVDKRFVPSLDNIARWMKLSPDVAGATLLALGTSAPEISTALIALFLEGANPATGVGTIVGSAIFQILVVIGFAAAVRTVYLSWKIVVRDSLFYAFSVILLLIFINDDKFELWEAIVLVSSYFLYLLILFLWMRYVKDKRADSYEDIEEESEENPKNSFQTIKQVVFYPIDIIIDLLPDPEKKPGWTVPIFIISLGSIGYVCYWLVLAAEHLAGAFGIPPAIIALTILAGGSSIPEMISSAIVAKQGRGNMAISNAIGSNTFDILMSLGLPVLIYIIVKGEANNYEISGLGGKDIYNSIILLFASLVLVLGMLTATRFKATRLFGGILVIVYLVYVLAAYMGWIAS